MSAHRDPVQAAETALALLRRKARLVVQGVIVSDDVLTPEERRLVRRVRHWYRLRGPYGAIGVARRQRTVYVCYSRLYDRYARASVPQLAAILAAAPRYARH